MVAGSVEGMMLRISPEYDVELTHGNSWQEVVIVVPQGRKNIEPSRAHVMPYRGKFT